MKILSSIKSFFSRLWRWFLDTAWIQVLLIVGVIIGVVLSISPLVNWISYLVEQSKESTFYRSNAITYDELVTKNGSDETNYVVIFHQESCTQCQTDQPYIEAFSKEQSQFTFYTIDIGDDDVITVDQELNLLAIYAPVYDNQELEDQNSQFPALPNDDFQTPTIVWYRDGGTEPYRVFLGMDNGSKAEAITDLNEKFEIE